MDTADDLNLTGDERAVLNVGATLAQVNIHVVNDLGFSGVEELNHVLELGIRARNGDCCRLS